MSATKISEAANNALIAWSAYLKDMKSFDNLAESMAKLQAAVNGRSCRPSPALEAMQRAGHTTIDQLPRHDTPFVGVLQREDADDAS